MLIHFKKQQWPDDFFSEIVLIWNKILEQFCYNQMVHPPK